MYFGRRRMRHNRCSHGGWAQEVSQVMDKLYRKWATPAKVATAAVLLVSGSGLSSPALAAAATRAGGDRAANTSNLSGNDYYPLVVGAKWTYNVAASTTTPAETFTNTVVSASKNAAGEEAVTLDFDSKGIVVKATYVVETNGSIEVQTASVGSTSVSGGGDFFIPTATQVTSCKPCHFSGTFNEKLEGLTMAGKLTETATSEGSKAVKVPAGSYTAQEIQIVVNVTASSSGMSLKDKTTEHVYLVKNVGMVETAGGTSTTTITGLGAPKTFTTPAEVLESYTS
jgi:hypothetical protein